MPESHRIKIKLGNAEFEAEGAPEDVQAQYDRFLELLSKSPPAPAAEIPATVEKRPIGNGDIDSETAGKVFGQSADGTVSLLILPRGETREADALLLILYGYRRQGNERVLGTQILRSANQSGITMRPAVVYPAVENLVLRGGQRKGTTYSLNNQGVIQAQQIARRLFE